MSQRYSLEKAPENELFTFRDWVRWSSSVFRGAELFYGHGTEDDYSEAIVLALWASNQPWERLDALWEARLTSEEQLCLFNAVKQRVETRCPAAYITGQAWFAGQSYIVNEDVLVPRSPIAELIDQAFEPWLQAYPETILDLCTGSGCIGIAMAHVFEQTTVDLVDISEEALVVARQNIALHGVEDRVTAIQSDGFASLEGKQYDLIVSNPPYVSREEYEALPQEYFKEPELGLVSGVDGFDFVRMLLKTAHSHLRENGVLVVEVGHDWQRFEACFSQYPFFWPDFENGGCGVFVLTREQLI